MAAQILLPMHYYLSLPKGAAAYHYEAGVTMVDPTITTGIYTTLQDPSFVFRFSSTQFNLRQAVAWYYNHRGYQYAGNIVEFGTGMDFKQDVIQFQLYDTSNGFADIGSNAQPGDTWLYGNVPFFGRVVNQPGDFQFAAMALHPLYGNSIGPVLLSQAKAVISLENFRAQLSNTKPKTTLVYPETGEVEEYIVDFADRSRTTKKYDETGVLVSTDVEENVLPSSFEGSSLLTTYPIQSDSFFFDAYGDFSGRYGNETQLRAAINDYNEETFFRQYDLPNCTFTEYPARQFDTLFFEGAAYYRISDGFIPSINSHRIL
jgi:hypothetical protein